ncbi:MAG TPA: hypothetical protein VM076_02300 [Gemmatimonadaceae bacterium]|nr:hypothetical protein [Gemmatimonadaceae bacterium]
MTRLIFSALVLLAAPLALRAQTPASSRVGTVQFETSCAPSVRSTFATAVAHLHSFGFADAVRSFNAVLATDSTCTMAYWGLALTAWANPFAAGIKPNAQLERGLAAVQRGRALNGGTDRERAYLAAAGRLYDNFTTADQRTRVLAYRDAMADLSARYPHDDEAAIFHALALAFSADPNDKTYAQLRKAGAILDGLATRLPNHPGIAHYLIHSYDVPALAKDGLTAANRYAKIAPASAHALHMPSHTYTRVGKWEESIATNRRSAEVAVAEQSYSEALHANDYLMYAYLQTGQDAAALRVRDGLASLASHFDPAAVATGAPPAAGFFAMAAIPARYALERGDWKAAAALDARETAFPFADAVTWFARGLGAARIKDTLATAEAVRQLTRLRDALASRKENYWSQQVEIQRRGVAAWQRLAQGDRSGAAAEMRATADLEATTEKNAITPGPIVPARELLAEMLLENGDAALAMREFTTTLTVEPGRFRALAGAMRAATMARDSTNVRRYARQLAEVATRGDDPGRPDLMSARGVATPR